MNDTNVMKDYPFRIENILRHYLDCNRDKFGVQTGELDCCNWKASITFALGYRYHESGRAPEVEEAIMELWNYDFDDTSEDNVEEIIGKLEKLLGVNPQKQ